MFHNQSSSTASAHANNEAGASRHSLVSRGKSMEEESRKKEFS